MKNESSSQTNNNWNRPIRPQQRRDQFPADERRQQLFANRYSEGEEKKKCCVTACQFGCRLSSPVWQLVPLRLLTRPRRVASCRTGNQEVPTPRLTVQDFPRSRSLLPFLVKKYHLIDHHVLEKGECTAAHVCSLRLPLMFTAPAALNIQHASFDAPPSGQKCATCSCRT